MSLPSRVDSYLDRPSHRLAARRSCPGRRPGPSGRSRCACPELEGHPGRRHPPADTHSVPALDCHPATTVPPQPPGCLILPREGRCPEEGLGGGYFRWFASPIGCCSATGTAYIEGAIFLQGRRRGLFWAGTLNHRAVFCAVLQLLPLVLPFRVFKAQMRQV